MIMRFTTLTPAIVLSFLLIPLYSLNAALLPHERVSYSDMEYKLRQLLAHSTTADRVLIDTGRSNAYSNREPNTADIKLINSTLTTSAQAPVEPTKYPQRKDENPFLTQAKRAEVTTFVISSLVVVLCFLGFFIYNLASYLAYGVGGVFASFCIWRTLQLLVELEEEIHYSSISNFLRYFSLNTILACMCTAAIVTGLAGFWTKYQRGARLHNNEQKESTTRTVGSVCHLSPMTYKETNLAPRPGMAPSDPSIINMFNELKQEILQLQKKMPNYESGSKYHINNQVLDNESRPKLNLNPTNDEEQTIAEKEYYEATSH
jgi:hypothetical protein